MGPSSKLDMLVAENRVVLRLVDLCVISWSLRATSSLRCDVNRGD